MASRKQRRIVHTSDVHLVSLEDRSCQGMESLVDVAIKTRADLVIIAGDLFDHNRVDDELVRFTVAQLGRLPVDAVILPGNHDCLAPDSVYRREGLWQQASNVRIFREPQGETLAFPGLGLSVWGKPNNSYEDNLHPLSGIPQPQGNGQWHIAVAHGYYYNSDAPLFLSYHITPEEIVASGRDYIALGHLITFRCVCSEPVTAYYSGSPAQTGAVAIVDLVEGTGVQVTRYPL